MATEIGYWAGLSGLTPVEEFSLHDHEYAAMISLTSATDAPPLPTLKHRYYQSVAPGTLSATLSVTDYEREYYIDQLGAGSDLSVDDLKSTFLATQ